MLTSIYHFFMTPFMLLTTKAMMMLIITVVASLCVNFTIQKLIAHCHKKDEAWRHVILTALLKPLVYLIILIGICMIIHVFLTNATDAMVVKIIPSALECGMIVFMSWVAINFINGAQGQWLQGHSKKKLDKTTIFAITKLARIIVIILALLFILPVFGIGISGLIAFGSVGGAAVAFASKDLLANFFGGIIVYFDKPFVIGDWIRSPDRNIEGTVEYIGWRSCRVRTFDLRPLYIPNSLFTTISIENASRMTHRQINTTIGLRYDDANHIKAIVDDIKIMLQTHPDIDTTQALIVNFVNFGSSTLDILIYAFTKTIIRADFQNIQQDIFLKIMDIINHYGAQCAFPTTTIDFPALSNTKELLS